MTSQNQIPRKTTEGGNLGVLRGILCTYAENVVKVKYTIRIWLDNILSVMWCRENMRVFHSYSHQPLYTGVTLGSHWGHPGVTVTSRLIYE